MNSFKPLTIYKGFVVPEEYVSGAMDSFDAVDYLQQIGLRKESIALKNVLVPRGYTVVNQVSGNVFSSGEWVPVNKADGKKIETWEEFEQYANSPDEPQWNITQEETSEDTTRDELTSENMYNLVQTTTQQIKALLSTANFKSAKEYLDSIKEQLEDSVEPDVQAALTKIETLSSVVDSLERQYLEVKAGLDDIPLAEKDDLEELVSKHGEKRAVLITKPNSVRANVFLDRNVANQDYLDSIDLGLFEAAYDIAIQLNEGNEKRQEELKNRKATFVESNNSNAKETLHMLGFLPDDLAPEQINEFLKKAKEISISYEVEEGKTPKQVGGKHKKILAAESDEEQQIRRTGQLEELKNAMLEFYEDSPQDLEADFDEVMREAELRMREISSVLDSNTNLDQARILENLAEKDYVYFRNMLFKNGKDTYDALVRATSESQAKDFLKKFFNLRDIKTKEISENFDDVSSDSFLTHQLIPKNKTIEESIIFADGLQRLFMVSSAYTVIRQTLTDNNFSDVYGGSGNNTEIYDATSERISSMFDFSTVELESVKEKTGDQRKAAEKRIKSRIKKQLQVALRGRVTQTSIKNDELNRMVDVIYEKITSESLDFSEPKRRPKDLDAIANYGYLFHQSYQEDDVDYVEKHNLRHVNEMLHNLLVDYDINFLSATVESSQGKRYSVSLSLLSGIRHLPMEQGSSTLNFPEGKRRELLDAAGYRGVSTDVFNDIFNHREIMVDVLNVLHQRDYDEEHHAVLAYQTKRLLPYAVHDTKTSGKEGFNIVSLDVVNNCTVEHLDEHENDFESHKHLEGLQKEIFGEHFTGLSKRGDVEAQQKAKKDILANIDKALPNLGEEERNVIRTYIENILDDGIYDFNNKGGHPGQHYEDLTFVPFLIAHAQQGNMKNIRTLNPEDLKDPSYLNNDKQASKGFYGTKGVTWETQDEEGGLSTHVLGGPSSTGSAIDVFYTKTTPTLNEVKITTFESKQEQYKGTVASLGQTTKALNFASEAAQDCADKSGSPDVKVIFKPSYHITMTNLTGEHSVDNFNLSLPTVLNPKLGNIQGVIASEGRFV